MAMSFKLGKFDLDVAGNVVAGGKWKTQPDNKIRVTPAQGDAETFDVAWSFNADNQLVLSSGGQVVANFNADKTVTPRFELRNAVLRVTPNLLDPFVLELRGEWNLTATHDLEFTPVGGAVSTIKGIISSPTGKFLFLYSDKKRPMIQQKLGFVGTWGTAKAGEGQLVFNYRREDGTEDTFELPAKITINKTTNQLRYEYKKGGVQAIDFEGTLIVNEDFTLSYHLTRQLSQTGEVMVGETTLSFGAVFQRNNFTGNLELTLTRPDGTAGATRLTIAGNFTGVLGKTNVAVGFTFSQLREGQQVTTTFGFAGKIQSSAGTIEFAFSTPNAAAGTIALTAGADIKLGKANVDARLNVDIGGGQVKGVTFLLGVRF